MRVNCYLKDECSFKMKGLVIRKQADQNSAERICGEKKLNSQTLLAKRLE